MLSGGPAVQYAQALLPEPRNRIVFTGYQDEGNPGYKLTALAQQGFGVRRVEVPNEEGEPIEIVAAAPAELFQLSAHADQTGLAAGAAAVNPRNIILVHGDRLKQEALNRRLAVEVPSASVRYGSLDTFAIE
jgi:metallo-beta-lactamase family protein